MFKIYYFKCFYKFFIKECLLLNHKNGQWSEVSPYPGKNQESLAEALAQLKQVQQGYKGPLYPSVTLGLSFLSTPKPISAPVCLFLNGSPKEILKQAEINGFQTAKIKLANFSLHTGKNLVETLKKKFRLRIDFQNKWPSKKVLEFCSYFHPSDVDFIEDPGCDISPYPMKTEPYEVWKPMVSGIPPLQSPVILSSVYESGVGIRQLIILAHQQKIPTHPLGIGTYLHLKNDVLQDRLTIENGHIHVFPSCEINTRHLIKI